MSELKTAAETLQAYLGTLAHFGDDRMLSLEDVHQAADIVCNYARAEGIKLEDLVPDEQIRATLLADSAEHQRSVQKYEDAMAEMDLPPDDGDLSVQALDDGGYLDPDDEI